MKTAARAARGSSSYWRASRAHRYSLVFALPLLVLYELLAAVLSHDPSVGGVRNGADVLLKALFVAAAGRRGPLLFMALVAAVSLWLVRRDLRTAGGRPPPGGVGGMGVESIVLALVFW